MPYCCATLSSASSARAVPVSAMSATAAAASVRRSLAIIGGSGP